MILTEEQARERWCPFTLVVTANTGDVCNRLGTAPGAKPLMPAGARCVASSCMAWRQVRPSYRTYEGDAETTKTPKGYCGLAGKPAD